jgi:hypothetical protein
MIDASKAIWEALNDVAAKKDPTAKLRRRNPGA